MNMVLLNGVAILLLLLTLFFAFDFNWVGGRDKIVFCDVKVIPM